MYTVVIPYSSSGDREDEFRQNTLFDNLKDIPDGVKVIVVEQRCSDIPFLEIDNATHIKVTHETFNKPWLLNIGVRESDTECVLLSDVDIRLPSDYLKNIARSTSGKLVVRKWIVGWDRLWYLDTTGEPVKKLAIKSLGAEGGTILFKKKFYMAMGGSNEFMTGLGGMDNELLLRARKILNKKVNRSLPFKIEHAWHPISEFKKANTDNFFLLNAIRRSHTTAMFVVKTIKQLQESMGDINSPLIATMKNPFMSIIKEEEKFRNTMTRNEYADLIRS